MPDTLVPIAAITESAWRGRDLSLAAPQGEVIVHLEGLHHAPPAEMPAARRISSPLAI